ncbi:MAG TPA: response regulator [Segetibacter sp.]|jgi:CheY-like chemotaxis protein
MFADWLLQRDKLNKLNLEHILIADDDEDDVAMLLEAIKNYDSSVRFSVVSDGKQLIEYLDCGSEPDIIILDLHMPCEDGKECLKVIRSNERYNAVPVIIYSAFSDPKEISECISYNLTYYIIKPLRLAEIVKLGEAIASGHLTSVY